MTDLQQRPTYHETLRTLSEASVERHFDPFVDIDWDDPAYAVDPTDPRWVLPSNDVLGRHPWYQSLPVEERARIGLYRQALITKVGLQFEQVLISGLMTYAFGLRNGNPEFRYSTHEATEECHHTQMFQEFVNRSGQDVEGGDRFFRRVAPYLPLFAKWAPFGFFYGVLAGEEPIDHMQKSILRAGEEMHPLLHRVPTGSTEVLAAGLVLRAIGYRGLPVTDLPCDPDTGTVRSDRGRVEPGTYVAGWAKRGPTGFLGTNKACAQETVERLLDDLDAGALERRVTRGDDLADLLAARGVVPVGLAGWRAVDTEELRRGAAVGRPREKVVDLEELHRLARGTHVAPRYARRGIRRATRGRGHGDQRAGSS